MPHPDRRALVVGINGYDSLNALRFAEADASQVATRLARHGDEAESTNYTVRELLGSVARVTRNLLRAQLYELFDDYAGDVLFYFAGHGDLNATGGHLVTVEGQDNDPGIPMRELVELAANSCARSVVLILDCCHAGDAGGIGFQREHRAGADQGLLLALRQNTTIITATSPTQLAMETGGHGLFTAALLDALDGGAADVLGHISTLGIYAHVEQRFGPWDQRPAIKCYVTTSTPIRMVKPRITILEFRRIKELFPSVEHRYQLDPEYDPWEDLEHRILQADVPEKREIGRLFKKYRNAGLVHASVAGEDLYWTAQHHNTVELTAVGRQYWMLARSGLL